MSLNAETGFLILKGQVPINLSLKIMATVYSQDNSSGTTLFTPLFEEKRKEKSIENTEIFTKMSMYCNHFHKVHFP